MNKPVAQEDLTYAEIINKIPDPFAPNIQSIPFVDDFVLSSKITIYVSVIVDIIEFLYLKLVYIQSYKSIYLSI